MGEPSPDGDGDAWEPQEQSAAALRPSAAAAAALAEILRWRTAAAREAAEQRAAASGGGLFDFDDPCMEVEAAPQEPLLVAPPSDGQVQARSVGLAAAWVSGEAAEAEAVGKSARAKIQQAMEAELEVIPLGDFRRRGVRQRAAREIAQAPKDPPPSIEQMNEWGRLLCLLQKEHPDDGPLEAPRLGRDGRLLPRCKPVIIEEKEALEILRRRANVHLKVGDLQRRPLHAAAARGYPRLVEELVRVRADPDEADFAGETPLHVLAHSGAWCPSTARARKVSIQNLVAGRADVNFANPRGRTALHIAASSGDLLAMQVLIAEGADVNAADLGGFTPLMWAAGAGSTGVVQALLDSAADPQLQGNRGQTAALFALTNQQALVVETLESHSALMDGRQERMRMALQEEEKEAAKAAPSEGGVVAVRAPLDTRCSRSTLHQPYMGRVREDFVPDLSSNAY